MLTRIFEIFSGFKATLIGGTFLVASLVLMLTKTPFLVDPAWVTIIVCGFPLLYLAISRIIVNEGMSKISSALLISIAMIASIIIGELFAAGEVAFIMAIGAILEEKTINKAKKGLKNLIRLTPQEGRILFSGGNEKIVPIDQIKQGDILRVLPGEAIPVDGEVVAGNSSVDQSIMTGESFPVDKSVGNSVFCGTINCFGSIDLKATRVGEDSSLQKLIRLVQEADNNKAPMQRLIDRWAAWLVPLVLAIAIVTYFATGSNIIRAVTVLVVFCPCALALATPTSIIAAIGQATKHGVIIKSGDALERMGKVNTIAFDKTGTLTSGNLVVTDVFSFREEVDEKQVMQIAASAEVRSEHPFAKAILTYAKKQEIELIQADEFHMVPGRGITARVKDELWSCGNMEFVKEHVHIDETRVPSLNQSHQQGKAILLVAKGDLLIGAIALSDVLRPTAKGVVQELRKMETEVVLLTGDHTKTANYFAKQVGIGEVHSELLPSQKVEQIQFLQQQGRNICMIGDGVNDAPALKTADVGIAMGSMGSDIAIDAADIALIGDDISKISYLIKLSHATLKLIKMNIALSMAINFVAVGLSIFGILNPITGALVHNAGSILVVLNAALLYDKTL